MFAACAEAIGFQAVCTTDPGVFFDRLRTWNPAYISLDLLMPAMDGLEVLEELARLGCRAGIIVSSGTEESVLRAARQCAEARGLNILGILPKPVTPRALQILLDRDSGTAANSRSSAKSRTRLLFHPDELRNAIAEHRIVVHYQPKVNCVTGCLAGFEALARWDHPEKGIIHPDDFIPVAEAHSLIPALTHEVFEQALCWYSRNYCLTGEPDPGKPWQPDVPTLALNISAQNLNDSAFVPSLLAQCARWGASPRRLILELTETTATDDSLLCLNALTRLRVHGFSLAIDDFGTGFSCISQLLRLPFNEIKIDKRFVMAELASSETRTIMSSIVQLARKLGLQCTAEGVDDASTLDLLVDMGCDYAQGFLLGRPEEGACLDASDIHRLSLPARPHPDAENTVDWTARWFTCPRPRPRLLPGSDKA